MGLVWILVSLLADTEYSVQVPTVLAGPGLYQRPISACMCAEPIKTRLSRSNPVGGGAQTAGYTEYSLAQVCTLCLQRIFNARADMSSPLIILSETPPAFLPLPYGGGGKSDSAPPPVEYAYNKYLYI